MNLQKFNEFTEGQLKITHITNCAVLIEYGAVKLLADGIFSGRQPFDVMDPATEEQILRGEGRFGNIGYILVTHCHNDHYNGSKILRFLEAHPGVTLLVPSNARLDGKRLEQSKARVIRMEEQVEVLRRLDFGSFQIEFMKTEHLTYRYPEHYCINVVTAEENVLLTADMSLDRIEALRQFTRRTHSAIFVSQIFLWHKKWKRQLLELGYTHIYFYHLPSEEKDGMGYRKRALTYWKKCSGEFPNGRLLGYEDDSADCENCGKKERGD